MEGHEEVCDSNKTGPTGSFSTSEQPSSAKRKRATEDGEAAHDEGETAQAQDVEGGDDGGDDGRTDGHGDHDSRRKLARLEERVAELEAENALYRCIVETQEVLVVVMNTRAQIVRFNRACQEATGYSAAEAEGADLFDLLIPPDQTPDVRRVFDALHEPEDDLERFVVPGQRWKNFWRTKDGRLILTRWRNDSVPDARTGLTKYVVATGVVIDAAPTAKDEFLLRRVVNTPSQSPAL